MPIQTLKAGALGTHNTLGVAKSNKAKFMLASTSEIYGDPLEHPQKETYWGHVVVEDHDAVAVRQEPVAQVRSNKPRPSGNQHSHTDY